jgi:hypothetical protein
MSSLLKLCDDYLNDRLSDTDRKEFEERLAKGDKELLETYYQLKAFSKARQFASEVEKELYPRQEIIPETQLLKLVTGESSTGKSDNDLATNPHNREGLSDVLQALEDKKNKKIRKYSTWALSILLLICTATILFLQWETYLSKQKLELTAKQFNALAKERDELRLQYRQAEFDLDRITSLAKGDYFLVSKILLKQNKGEWIQFWDRGTLRIAVLLNKPKILAPEKLHLFSLNAKTNEWQLVGSINEFKEDSIYTSFDSQQLARSVALRIESVTQDEFGKTISTVLGELKIK